ncbi:MAG: hypothetical protein ACLR2O_04630 [Coprococcus sp.]
MHHARKRNSDEPISSGSYKGKSTFDTKKIATFCDHLLDAYIEKSPEEKNAVVKMKELWWYLGKNFKKQRRISDANPQKPDHPGIPDGG